MVTCRCTKVFMAKRMLRIKMTAKLTCKTCSRHSFRFSEGTRFLRSKQTDPVPAWFEKFLPAWRRHMAPSGAHRWSYAEGSWIPQGFANLKGRATGRIIFASKFHGKTVQSDPMMRFGSLGLSFVFFSACR